MSRVSGHEISALHDYMGEPGRWPHVSSSFGAIDLAGFPKPPAWFYRSKVSLLTLATTHLDAERLEAVSQLRPISAVLFLSLVRILTLSGVSFSVRVCSPVCVSFSLSRSGCPTFQKLMPVALP